MAGILFGILFLSLFIGVPIAISLGVAASLTMMLTNNAQYLASIPTRMFTQLDSFTLMAVPFFILAGNIMAEGGISDRLISFFELLLKRLLDVCPVSVLLLLVSSEQSPDLTLQQLLLSVVSVHRR